MHPFEDWLKRSDPWLRKQAGAFKALRNSTVSRWRGVEFAFDEDPITWEHPTVPMLQFSRLAGVFDGQELVVTTDQGYDGWSLGILPLDASSEQGHGPGTRDSVALVSAYGPEATASRARPLPELPVGLITRVDVVVDEGLITRVSLLVGADTVELAAGEVWPEADGQFRVVMTDESVLVQVNGKRPSAD